MNSLRCTIAVLALFMALASFQITGCGSSGGGGSSGVEIGGVSLSISESSIPADGFSSTTVQIALTDETGASVAMGTKANISTDLGTFSQNGAQSLSLSTPDDSGSITVSLIASVEDGTATITVQSGGVTQRATITFTPSSTDPGVTTSISISATPTSIPADGVSSTSVTITMTQADGSPVGDSASVVLTTTLGSFSASSDLKTITLATEGSGGSVVTSLISSSESGVAVLQAQAGDVSQKTNVVFTSATDSFVIAITSAATNIPADGETSTSITVTMTHGGGGAVEVGTEVKLQTTLGSFDTSGSQEVTMATQDNSGAVTVSLIAGNEPGSAVITATAGNVTQTLTITVVGTTSSIVINMGATAAEMPADGASSIGISITMTQHTGSPVAVGTSVQITTSLGSFDTVGTTSQFLVTADDTGTIIASLIAGRTPGFAQITAEAEGVTQRLDILLTQAGNFGEPTGEAFTVAPGSLNISGWTLFGIQNPITAWASDSFGNAVADNHTIEFKTYNTGGQLENGFGATDNGFASTILTSVRTPRPQQGYLAVTAETMGDSTVRVTSLAVADPPNQNIMYAGTNGGGVYKSVNGGNSWENVSRSNQDSRHGQNFMNPYIRGHRGICVDPDNPNTVYAGTGYLGDGDMYRSLDGGMNWNSNNVEEWTGLDIYWRGGGGGPFTHGAIGPAAVLTVLCDGDSESATDYPYVWAGTDGRGFFYSTDGANFQPSGGVVTSGPTPGPDNTGVGGISSIRLWYSTQPETWTATAVRVPSRATTPVLSADAVGDGTMSTVATNDLATVDESWTVTYSVDVGPVTTNSGGNVFDIQITQPHGADETFTLNAFEETPDDPATPDDETVIAFTVTSSVTGMYPNAQIGAEYDQGNIVFTIIPGPAGLDRNDWFSFTVTGRWDVMGGISLEQSQANTGVTYTSDNGAVNFTIFDAQVDFAHSDQFTFTTYGPITAWSVSGSVSGLQSYLGISNGWFFSDNREVSFYISESLDPEFQFPGGDYFTFTVAVSTVNHGRVVWDIERINDSHGANAILYAGTATGVFKTINGGVLWEETGNFAGDSTTTVALHPSSNGNNDDILYAGTQDAGVWISTNSGGSWTALNEGIYVTEEGVETPLSVQIRDIIVDPANHRLYGIAIKENPVNGAKLGKVYVHDLNANGTPTQTPWREIQQQLPPATPAPYVLAFDHPSNPTQIYMGTEGINLYTATDGVLTGDPVWRESKTGITNRIMARTPMLYSSDVTLYGVGKTVLLVDDDTAQYAFYWDVYFEDENGNPPVAGTTLKIAKVPASGDGYEYIEWEYGDDLFGPGTFRDPGDPRTNRPIRIVDTFFSGDAIEVTMGQSPSEPPDPPGGNSLIDNWAPFSWFSFSEPQPRRASNGRSSVRRYVFEPDGPAPTNGSGKAPNGDR